MPTVVQVTWFGDYPGTVTYDVGVDVYQRQGLLSGDRYSAWLVGCAPDHALDYVLTGLDGDTEFTTGSARVATGSLPDDGLALHQEVGNPDAIAPGLLLVAWRESNAASGVSLIDSEGTVVWLWETESGFQIEAAEWVDSGVWVMMVKGGSANESNEVVFVDADGSINTRFAAPNAHHDLHALSTGGVAWLQTEVRDLDNWGSVVGDVVVIADENGDQTEAFNTFEALTVTRSNMWDGGFYTEGSDWTHANGLFHRASDNTFLVSLAGLNTLLEVDAATGSVNWTLEGSQVTPSDARFAMQHSPSWTSEGTLLLFDNEGWNREDSWVAEYKWTPEALEEIWYAGLDEGLYTPGLGHAERVQNGNTIAAYGTIGVVVEFGPGGDRVRKLSYDGSMNLLDLSLVDSALAP
jgi:hypothetical protein